MNFRYLKLIRNVSHCAHKIENNISKALYYFMLPTLSATVKCTFVISYRTIAFPFNQKFFDILL